ncbi:hypothetical protein ASPSYDRAFT_52437 [Aspergillus sydowii CBS 593.65]|uniref:Uncharacterized protein n=1 Tax=Aspergillus sydowii CBS 593.65 TaxID=1036612 RepID=A0A1L9SY70_9EURO|nr:uncharacterized protein ASPSYDRAFT_52437 [Aspergillus sydowii CBS 593.65]OJJ52174.1 hypothetical protein ASPSYDRAFT_52437 [Aspergillus sydowii CBS 593.65]
MFSANQVGLLPLSLAIQTSRGYKACGRYMRQFCHWRAVEMRAYARRAQKTVGQGSARDGIGCDAGQLRQQTRGRSRREGLSNRVGASCLTWLYQSLVVEEIQY